MPWSYTGPSLPARPIIDREKQSGQVERSNRGAVSRKARFPDDDRMTRIRHLGMDNRRVPSPVRCRCATLAARHDYSGERRPSRLARTMHEWPGLECIRRQTVETFLNAACAQGRVRPVSQLYEGNLLPTLQAQAVDPRPCLAERQNILAARTRPIHLNTLLYEAHALPPVLRVSWSPSAYSAEGTSTSG